MKLLILTDLHHGSDNTEYMINYQLNFLDEMKELIESEKIDAIVNLGDTHDKRLTVNVRIMELFKRKHMELASAVKNYYVIAGNHDCYYTNTNDFTSLNAFFTDDYRFTKIINHPLVIGNMVFIPWISSGNSQEITEFVSKCNKKSNVLFGHLELSGFQHGGTVSKHDQLMKSDYDKYKRVFSGHYHGYQERDNIIYPGTPYAKNFGELEDKRILVYDTETDEVERYINEKRIFEKIVINDESLKEIENIIKINPGIENKIVRLHFNTKVPKILTAVENMITEAKPYSIDISYSSDEVESDMNDLVGDDVILTSEEIHEEYFKRLEVDSEEQREELKSEFTKLWNETHVELEA
jgi:predicted phosphodiesterase